MIEYLCMGEPAGAPGGSHFWGHAGREKAGTQFVTCPDHDGGGRAVSTEPLHIHECFECGEVFSHREGGCGTVGFTAARFVCWECEVGR